MLIILSAASVVCQLDEQLLQVEFADFDPFRGMFLSRRALHVSCLEATEALRSKQLFSGGERVHGACRAAHGVSSVSYTPLDVYKRQSQGCFARDFSVQDASHMKHGVFRRQGKVNGMS